MAKRKEGQRESVKEKGSEFDEKVLFINRCSKVVKGGRKFSFSALVLIGDRKGRVGFGFSKANELTDAIHKAGEAARKNIITFPMEHGTIPHEILMNWDGACILLKPAPEGTGVIAGSKVRAICEMAGLENIVSKSLGSNNPINQVRATFKALKSLCSHEQIQKIRGMA